MDDQSETKQTGRHNLGWGAIISIISGAALVGASITQMLGISLGDYFRLPDKVKALDESVSEIKGVIETRSTSDEAWHQEEVKTLAQLGQKLDDMKDDSEKERFDERQNYEHTNHHPNN